MKFINVCSVADSNGGTDGDALDEISVRNANHDSGPAGETRNGRNQLGEILGTLGDPQVDNTSATGQRTQTNETPSATKQMGAGTEGNLFLVQATMEARAKGDHKTAEALLRSLAALFPDTSDPREEIPTTTRSSVTTNGETTQKEAGPDTGSAGTIQKVGAVSYMAGEFPDHTYSGLPAFYDKNVKAMKGSIPLTIFDPIWQRIAAANHIEKNTVDKSSTEERRYSGTPAPKEWSQSYAQWSRNYQSFIAALRDVYNFTVFADWFKIHRDRCDEMMRSGGFCAGFRYDLRVRANAFQCDFVRNEITIFPDVSQFREDIAREALAEVRRNEETGYIDNPYISGGKKENYDPHTGLEKSTYGRNGGEERGRNGSRPQQRSTTHRYRSEHNEPRGYREDYKAVGRSRREEQPYGGKRGYEGRERGYEERPSDRAKGYKPHQGYKNDSARGRRRHELIRERDNLRDDEKTKPPVRWPTEVTCEMNTTVWKEALTRAGLLPKYTDVLVGFQEGFSQGIPAHSLEGLRWYTPPNHTSAEWAKDEIIENFYKERSAGRMFGPFSHEEVARHFTFFRSSPLGAVENSDGSIRPINDLSFPRDQPETPSVNSFVDKDEFSTTWDDFKTVAGFFRQNNSRFELGLFDWEKAYRQIPTRMDQWPYLFVQDFDGNLFLDTRITFGGVAGCGSFGRPADAWKEIMMAEFDLIHVFCGSTTICL
ncbi:hypothetical protein PSHT_04707 [Puccinia striiformis]|uniref:Uncharacterized protein n=1 Tax=Puccinia striiformis TaxID=27350 RepID=A0A2S4WCF2_9BASI|nr:hypothetical protein PSHT_04707 [Puccinia striiformis]